MIQSPDRPWAVRRGQSTRHGRHANGHGHGADLCCPYIYILYCTIHMHLGMDTILLSMRVSHSVQEPPGILAGGTDGPLQVTPPVTAATGKRAALIGPSSLSSPQPFSQPPAIARNRPQTTLASQSLIPAGCPP